MIYLFLFNVFTFLLHLRYCIFEENTAIQCFIKQHSFKGILVKHMPPNFINGTLRDTSLVLHNGIVVSVIFTRDAKKPRIAIQPPSVCI